LLHVFCIAVLLSFGVLAQFKLKPKVLVAQYDAVAIERIKAEWMQSPLWMKDYHILLNGIQSLQNDINMLRRNLLNEGEIGADASFKPRRLAAAEESIFDSLSDEEFDQWIDIMSRIKWTSLKGGDRRRLSEGEEEDDAWLEELKRTQTDEARVAGDRANGLSLTPDEQRRYGQFVKQYTWEQLKDKKIAYYFWNGKKWGRTQHGIVSEVNEPIFKVQQDGETIYEFTWDGTKWVRTYSFLNGPRRIAEVYVVVDGQPEKIRMPPA